ncbi:MAG: hypothetical protein C4290_06950 [Chloroflexota bacterium]
MALTWRVPGRERQEALLGVFGPLSLILLIALWAAALVLGFALVLWGGGTALRAPQAQPDFATFLYLSGVTFFTLGFGDVVPRDALGRTVAVVEVATGFGFLALVVSYLPVLYQAFSRREAAITLLDARAGSPPCAVELLRRYQRRNDLASISTLLAEWERWCAELLESHLSYPQLMFYRSQHERQSWVAALTAILDLSALVLGLGRAHLRHGAARRRGPVPGLSPRSAPRRSVAAGRSRLPARPAGRGRHPAARRRGLRP